MEIVLIGMIVIIALLGVISLTSDLVKVLWVDKNVLVCDDVECPSDVEVVATIKKAKTVGLGDMVLLKANNSKLYISAEVVHVASEKTIIVKTVNGRHDAVALSDIYIRVPINEKEV